MSSHLALAWIPALDTFEECDLEQLKAAVMETRLEELFDQDPGCLGFETLEEARAAVLQDIDEMAELYASQACSVVSFEFSHPKLIAGGMSYGDAPTEQFSQIVRLGACKPVHELLRAWSATQYADKRQLNVEEEKIRKRAEEMYADDSDDDIEIDRGGRLSRSSDGGWWVAAWVWVPDYELEDDDDED